MIIGNFTYNAAKDTYAGEIRTLTLLRNKIAFRPNTPNTDKGPSYRVVIEGVVGAIELGAAWKRTSDAGRDFLSVSLDDPALDRPLNAALMPSEDGNHAILIWSRPAKSEPRAK
ncbi:MAG: DUF736 domain-containing protein [Steroidobacteraceae bacterium]|jgi:uncharacterized protein (DUF736 family)